ncbi:MAG: ATP-dependent protease La, ATP-dependent Lon protease [candidate division NC10 bacterium CSP1-5]|nr:MAG: ATP-dependent protease La, ATP-dependent Lon protease [candidate division NC10 bacterium CSP1-5]
MRAQDTAQSPPPGGAAPIPRDLPLLPLRGTVLFPHVILPILVGQEKSIRLVDEVVVGNRMLGVVALKDQETQDPRPDDLFPMGTAAVIAKMIKLPDGTISIMVQGLERIRLGQMTQTDPYFRATVVPLPDHEVRDQEVDALVLNLRRLFQQAVDLSPNLPAELAIVALNIDEGGMLADMITSNLNLSVEEKQAVLEITEIKPRLRRVTELLTRHLESLELSRQIQDQVKAGMDKSQREYYLREQLKAIQQELGEGDERTQEAEELRRRIDETPLSTEVREAALRELGRLARMPPAAAEYSVVRTYLEWLLDLPWLKGTEDRLDIAAAEQILNQDHYDLEKVKKRILEYLAVRKLKKDMKGPILCFVGPPGVGKTSLGHSIAAALGRKFIRISLGGIRDEAEIRGHRRTYVGALPGRIIQSIRKAGSNNPVFMLDEVDKIGADFRGDPSSALLEVLDPEQNTTFSDHYLELPFDLSRVMFIATANILDPIPAALRDRMEVLELPGYTDSEKLHIARRYLVQKQLEAHGLTAAQLTVTDDAIREIISSYTREAGVRNLEREIAAICRAVAKQVSEGRTDPVIVTAEDLHPLLGPIKFFSEVAERTAQPGVATGLAWTPTGGEIIFVEATKMPGKGNLILTGHLGEVMKESAQAALSAIRSRSRELDLAEDFFLKQDIHIHVPAAAIPKDGPSAGITMFTALLSLVTGRPVQSEVGMTGEITLRGQVLPVGGIKEKALAAKRAGLKAMALPERNAKDLEDIRDEVRQGLEFRFIRSVDQIPEMALVTEEALLPHDGR